MRPPRLLLILVAACAFFAGRLRAEEPFFKKGDVIAILGGEDMVALSEYGYLELLLTRALPDYHLRFRNLAWEGDTVFEQRRDLNFPTWEQALEKIGATVVLCQFGQMESLGKGGSRKAEGGSEAAKAEVAAFIAAYQKLLGRLSGGGKRRVVLLAPLSSTMRMLTSGLDLSRSYADAVADLAQRSATPFVDIRDTVLHDGPCLRADGIHLNEGGHRGLAWTVGSSLDPEARELYRLLGTGLGRADNVDLHRMLALIIAKNRLWFDYWRVQNWAFLAGDRTNQPSSRDHLDPTKRWFPEERERFLPLIEAKEKEIDALAAKLAQP